MEHCHIAWQALTLVFPVGVFPLHRHLLYPEPVAVDAQWMAAWLVCFGFRLS